MAQYLHNYIQVIFHSFRVLFGLMIWDLQVVKLAGFFLFFSWQCISYLCIELFLAAHCLPAANGPMFSPPLLIIYLAMRRSIGSPFYDNDSNC